MEAAMLRGDVAKSAGMTLDEVVSRLSMRARVEGVLLIGSAGADKLTPASDYDVVVVLTEMPEALDPCGVTTIDGRLTDLLFVSTGQLDEILGLDEPVDGEVWLGRIIRWFETGAILFDREEQLARVQRKVRAGRWVTLPNKDLRGPWRGVNFNLAQSKRLLKSGDPVYLIAAELRCAIYGAADLLFNYFDIRRQVWEGEKAAVRYLMAEDPGYLDLLRRFAGEGELARKFELYEELAALTVAPVGELWAEGVTVLALSGPASSPEAEAEVLNLWEALLAGV
jgi:predicted nucleotidyltransferase